MLPLLPALILLILQGPTNVERMALDGRLPAVLNAIHRQMEATPGERTALSRADGVALVSAVYGSDDPRSASQRILKSIRQVRSVSSLGTTGG